jgi:glutathione synthase/RimK-type ligase-like ATP-grasp enzyme
VYLYSHSTVSEGAKELAAVLKVQRIRHENSNFRGRADKVVINWGSSTLPEEVGKCRIINPPDKVVKASNKFEFFNMLSKLEDAPRLVPWTTSYETAVQWWLDKKSVVCRSILNGSGGAGIRIAVPDETSVTNAKLYTQYIPKKDEYRVHFVNGKIIDYQRKALRPDFNKDLVNWKVRNLDGGFIYVRNEVVLPPDVTTQAEKTIKGLGLDFGAIDIIYNDKQKAAYVLEVNTAPGLMGTTLANYAKAFDEAYRPNASKVA